MTDRELLELAAKAAGMPPPWNEHDVFTAWIGGDVDEGGHWWNPIYDDGDALVLAVSLFLDIIINRHQVQVGNGNRAIQALGDDPHAATRLAIVLAAAEIGSAMS